MPSLKKRDPEDPNNPYRTGQKNEKGMTICGAKTRQGKPCQQTGIMGKSGRCRLHGGASLKGIASGRFKDGSLSKYILPDQKLQDLYEFSVKDPELVQLREEIALLDVRIQQIVSDVEKGTSDELWEELAKVWGQFVHAVRTSNDEKQMELFPVLNRLITAGSDVRKTWSDVERLVDGRRKLVEAQSRLEARNNQHLTIQQVVYMLTAVITSVREAARLYTDPTTAQHILTAGQQEYNRLLVDMEED